MKTQEKMAFYKPRKKPQKKKKKRKKERKRTQTCQYLKLGLLASRTVKKNKFLFFNSPHLWYFVMVALANKYRRLFITEKKNSQ